MDSASSPVASVLNGFQVESSAGSASSPGGRVTVTKGRFCSCGHMFTPKGGGASDTCCCLCAAYSRGAFQMLTQQQICTLAAVRENMGSIRRTSRGNCRIQVTLCKEFHNGERTTVRGCGSVQFNVYLLRGGANVEHIFLCVPGGRSI